MYVIARNHDIPYFVNKSGGIISWSSREDQAHTYTLIEALYIVVVLKYITGDTSITSKGI